MVVVGGFGVVQATTHEPENPSAVRRTAVVPAPPANDTGNGRESRRTLPPVARAKTVEPAAGLTVAVEEIRATASNALGPGMMSGPAVTVTVTVRNETGRPVRAPGGGTMTLTYGPEDTPADISPQQDDQAVPAVIAAGSEVSGSYTFLVPEDKRSELTITFDYRQSDPAAVFTGVVDNGGAGQ
ncbi:hypothetical protein [Kocuria sp. CH-021]|uniref:hypothetical protein n=1 Tax=Kocuria sp. CH-021 TaxID=3406735 RepID=UPI003C74FBD6